jgi:hypothetical protein
MFGMAATMHIALLLYIQYMACDRITQRCLKNEDANALFPAVHPKVI